MARAAGILRAVTVLAAVLLASGCASYGGGDEGHGLKDREAIEAVLARANLGFELGDADAFAGAFAPDASYELNGPGPVFGCEKMSYRGRAEIRQIITDRLE